MNGSFDKGVPVSQSIVANVQLGLPATVSKLSSKMRFIDKIAPLLKEQGVIRTLDLIQPITIKCSGIATSHRTINAFGGILYISGAVRQDISSTTEPGVKVISIASNVTSTSRSKSVSSVNMPGVKLRRGCRICFATTIPEVNNSCRNTNNKFTILIKEIG
jgi:hypothetical protein